MNGNDWANILGEPTFEEKWASSLADIGIFPTEKIYGKDIQTPTIGIEPPRGTGLSAEAQREINERWARIDREKQEEQERRRREEEEKRKRGGVSLEEYNKRIADPENWKLEQGRWRWIGPTGGGTYADWYKWKQEKEQKEKYPELTNYDKEVSKFMRTNEYNAMSGMDKLKFYEMVQDKRNKIKGGIDKKLQTEKVAREKLEAKIPPEQMRIYIKAVDEGQMSKGALAYILTEQGYPDDYIDNITAGLRDRLTVDENIKIENQRRKWIEEDREYPYDNVVKLRQQYQETRDYTLYAAGLQNLGLTKDERNELLPVKLSALEELKVTQLRGTVEEEAENRRIRSALKELYPEMAIEGFSYAAWEQTKIDFLNYEEKVRSGEREEARDELDEKIKNANLEFKTEQATIKHGEWVVEEGRLRDELTIKTEQWEKQFDANEVQRLVKNEQIRISHLEKKRAAEAQEKLTGDRDLMNYTIDTSKNELAWELGLHSIGLENKEFIQNAYEFTKTFDFNKVKEEIRAREFGQEYRFSVQQETNAVNQFEQTLTREYADLNVKINRLGLDREIEGRLAKTAEFTAMMEIKKHGLAKAKQRLEGIKARKEWIFKERYWQLDSAEAETAIFKIMSDTYNDAETLGLETALNNARIANMQKRLEFDYYKLEQEDTPGIELSTGIGVTVGNMSPEMQGEVTRWIGTIYDKDKGFYHPKPEEWEKINNFLFGKEGDPRPKERFGVNLDVDEFIRGCAGQFDFSDQMRGWLTVTRDKEFMWEKVIAAGVEKGVYIAPEIEEAIKKPGWFDTGLGKTLGRIGETFKNWFTFTEPVAPGVELTPRVTKTGNIATDAENILTQYGQDISRNDMRKYLSDMGYNETEINTILGG